MRPTRRSLIGVVLLLCGLLVTAVGLVLALVAVGAARATRVPPDDWTYTPRQGER
jgi:hypothetical protein